MPYIIPHFLHTNEAGQYIPKPLGIFSERQFLPKKGERDACLFKIFGIFAGRGLVLVSELIILHGN